MACDHRLCNFTISYFFLILSLTQFTFTAESRHLKAIMDPISSAKIVSEEKVILRGVIGSRPPRCERRCSSCAHCEAIQVPANQQVKSKISNSTRVSKIAYSRGDDYSSNYKPMSWKCKCGNFIFNP